MTFSPEKQSPASEFVEFFRHFGPDVAPTVLLAAWDQLSIVEQAAIANDWSFWARPKQLPPPGNWRTWGFLTGRRFGKTVAVSKWINGEVEAGRARLLGCCAQDEQSSIDIQINGPSGLIATASPFFRPVFEPSSLRLTWPNGATMHVRSPEAPGKIRGLEYELYWASELQSWPVSTREEAWYAGVETSTSVGYARIVWDCTPKRRHPLLKALLAMAESDPSRHHIVRGTTHENAINLAPGYMADIERQLGGTQRGREELFGEMLDDAEGALIKQGWIDARRRPEPARYARKVLSVDPAVTNRRGSDTTGIIESALGTDGQAYVLRDGSGKLDASKWGELLLDWYVQDECDLLIAETNKGGQLVVTTLRALAQLRGLEVIVVGKDERPIRQNGKVFVKEVYARGAKEERAEPVATAYERGRISHVLGAALASLEDTLTTWEPAPNADSPGDLDALVHAMVDLLDLSKNEPNAKQGFVGIGELARQVAAPPKTNVSLNRALSFHRFGQDRI